MKFLFDEQMSVRLARALQHLGKTVVHVQDVDELGKGKPDEIVLRYAGAHGYRLISGDKRINTNPHERAAYMAAGVGVYFVDIGRKGKPEGWEIVKAIVKHWEAIESHAEKTTPPYMMLLRHRGGLSTFR